MVLSVFFKATISTAQFSSFGRMVTSYAHTMFSYVCFSAVLLPVSTRFFVVTSRSTVLHDVCFSAVLLPVSTRFFVVTSHAALCYVTCVPVPFFFLSTRFGVAVFGFFGLVAMTSQQLAITLILPCMLSNTSLLLMPQPAAGGGNGKNAVRSACQIVLNGQKQRICT